MGPVLAEGTENIVNAMIKVQKHRTDDILKRLRPLRGGAGAAADAAAAGGGTTWGAAAKTRVAAVVAAEDRVGALT